jgi:hypothetical protein
MRCFGDRFTDPEGVLALDKGQWKHLRRDPPKHFQRMCS